MIKQILSLPINTAEPAIYIISGLLPAEAEVHKFSPWSPERIKLYNARLDFFRFSSIVAVLESLKCLWIPMCAVWSTIGIALRSSAGWHSECRPVQDIHKSFTGYFGLCWCWSENCIHQMFRTPCSIVNPSENSPFHFILVVAFL
jgi:hypothetical protein